MSNLPVARNHDPPDPSHANPASHDDMSDVTVNNGRKPDENQQTMTSKVVKFSFVYDDATTNRVPPSVIHTHWMQSVQEAMGNDIIIINNHNKPVETVSTITWADPSVHQKQFKLYQKTVGRDDKRNTTYYILHRVQTNESISKIKSLPSVKRLLKDYKCFITDHQWSETEWDTTRVGFVTNLDPSFYNRTQAHHKFNEILHSRENARKVKIPQFRMVFSSPQVRHASHTVSTKAYAVEVLNDNAAMMIQVLQTLFRDTPTFVPYTLRCKYPDGYEKAIRYQTHLLQGTMVVILQNISNDMMFYLQEHIMTVPGVRALLESPKGKETGQYSILVDKDQFARIRATLKNALPNWVNEFVEIDAQPSEYQFPGPARVKPLFDDGFSSGENSWMTTSNASFMSIELPSGQDDDFFNTSMNANRIFTYDECPLPSTTSKLQFSEAKSKKDGGKDETKATKPLAWSTATSELTETESHQQQEIARLTEEQVQAKQASLKANKIIEAQRAEIEELKAQRLGDNANRAKEALEAKQAQSIETINLRTELRNEMKCMMQQFMESLKFLTETKTPESNKRPIATTEANNNPPSEKRRDDRTTPVKLFPKDMDLRDSNLDEDAMLAFKSNEHDDDL